MWARLMVGGWTKARMYNTYVLGPYAAVYTGRMRGYSCCVVPRLTHLRKRDPSQASQDKPANESVEQPVGAGTQGEDDGD